MPTWNERKVLSGNKAEFRSLSSKSDRLGNTVHAVLETNYSDEDAPYVRVWREDQNGVVIIGSEDIYMPPREGGSGPYLRADDLTMMIAGRNVHLKLQGHGVTIGAGPGEEGTDTGPASNGPDAPDATRSAYIYEMVFVDWYEPWDGQGQAGEYEGATTFIPGEPQPPPPPPTSQRFADVLPDHYAYAQIERLASEGRIGGYPCGTNPNEPCDAESRPYYRPNAPLTRGQLAKILG